MKAKQILFALLAAFALVMAGCSDSNNSGNDNPGGNNPGGNTGGGNTTTEQNFTIAVDQITASCANVTVTPKKSGTYYFDVIEKSEYDSYADPKVLIEEYIDEFNQLIEEYADLGLTLADFLSDIADSYYYACDLTPDTKYYAFAVGISTTGEITTDVEVVPFATRTVQPSNNTFSIAVVNDIVTVTPKNDTEYYLFNIFEGNIDAATASDSQIIEAILANAEEYGLEYFIGGGGEHEFDYTGEFTNGTTYTIALFGYDGGATTAVTRYVFTYEGSTSGGGDTGGDTGGDEGDLLDGITSLTGDKTLTIKMVEAEYYGDFYGTGTENWMLYAYTTTSLNTSTEGITLEFFSNLGSRTPVGSYTISEDTLGAVGNQMPGYMDSEGYTYGTWFMNYDGTSYAAAVSGNTTIAASGSNYNINISFKDCEGNTVKATYSGPVSIYEGQLASASVQSSKRLGFGQGALQPKSKSARLASKAKAQSALAVKPLLPKVEFLPKKVALR